MTVTTEAIRDDLSTIDALIAMLTNSDALDDEDWADLLWLHNERQLLQQLLAVRRAQRGQPVVSLALWRDGSSTLAATSSKSFGMRIPQRSGRGVSYS